MKTESKLFTNAESSKLENGFIKFFRNYEKMPWADDNACFKLVVFLMDREAVNDYPFNGTKIKKGQIAFTIDELASDLGWSRRALTRTLKKLQDSGTIKTQRLRYGLLCWLTFRYVNNDTSDDTSKVSQMTHLNATNDTSESENINNCNGFSPRKKTFLEEREKKTGLRLSFEEYEKEYDRTREARARAHDYSFFNRSMTACEFSTAMRFRPFAVFDSKAGCLTDGSSLIKCEKEIIMVAKKNDISFDSFERFRACGVGFEQLEDEHRAQRKHV